MPGIGESLGLTILYEMGDIERFPTVKDFLSYCRLVKGTVASAGKIKGLRGAKLGNPYLRWAFGEAAVIAKRDHAHHRPPGPATGSQNGRQQVQSQHRRGHQTGPSRLLHAQKQNRLRSRPAGGRAGQELILALTAGNPDGLTGSDQQAMPLSVTDQTSCAHERPGLCWAGQESGDLIGTGGQRLT